MGPGKVKNDKQNYFYTSHLTPNTIFHKNEVLKSKHIYC